jgi:hypothetical protein
MSQLPEARGPLSQSLLDHWLSGASLGIATDSIENLDPLIDEDLHLALWCCYQLHFDGFDGVDPDLEWDPETIAFRRRLEKAFEGALRDEHRPDAVPADPVLALRVISTWAGPPLSTTVAEGTRTMLEEFAVHRSIYQLKEADAHTFGIPRLSGPGRAAMIEIQADEYGGGTPGAAHAELFAAALEELGFDPACGAYVDAVPGTTLATDNLVTMFGLNRRLRGALVGHLALFEMCSVTPMSRYLSAARRIGNLPAMEEFYAVHVEADVEHSRLALDEMVAPFVEANPSESADVIFGAAALARVEARFARAILDAWDRGGSSLRVEPIRFLPPEPTIVLPSMTVPGRAAAPKQGVGADLERVPPLATLAS